MHTNLELAAKIHYSFMTRVYREDGLDIDVALAPLDRIGGDYCSINTHQDGAILLCICDVVGHDVVAALLAARINTLAMVSDPLHSDPCSLLESINKFLCTHLTDTGIYASMFCVLIDMNKRYFSYAGAAHPPALYYCALDHSVIWLDSVSTLVGFESPLPVGCQVNHQAISVGDKLFLYTDGVIEAKNTVGDQFGSDGLEEFIIENHSLDSKTFNTRLMRQLKTHSGGVFNDDVLFMTVGLMD